MQGRFIVLEGPDGSGTTTHARLLHEALNERGIAAILTCEPTTGPIGTFIRSELQKKDMSKEALQLLFTADRSWHIEKEIVPALKEGRTIVCERFALSTLLYAQATDVDAESLEALNKKFMQPDVSIILLPTFEECMNRLKKRAQLDMLEQDSIQKRVYDLYEKEARTGRHIVIDSGSDTQSVAAMVLKAALQ